MFNASCSVNRAEKNLGPFKQEVRSTKAKRKDILLSSNQQILNLPEGFTIGKAIERGDCFFDAVAQGLKQLNPGTNFTVKSLREVCRK
ncbi:hypothetical protein JKF54_00170 [Wolbachia endosymbiont of Spodoptera picta]|nr:hypothetical protein [Wolbachia endosymbiont of Spodoptera picta]QUI60444.1 hypothetical protein JKF54_00170 [Wolbachia endosymbiont of Spodoptera picta]